MSSHSLQDDLLSIPGVEGAEVEGSGDRPAGLRIRIAEGADQQAVGSAIRHVLTEHGLGTDTRLPGEPSGVESAEPAQAAVPSILAPEEVAPIEDPEPQTESEPAPSPVALLAEEVVDESEDDPVIDLTEPAPEDPESTTDDAISVEESPVVAAPESEVADAPPSEPTPEPPSDPSPVTHEIDQLARIDSVAVAEGREGIVVTVTSSDGRSERRVAASTEGGVENAVVRATARLALPKSPEAHVVEVEDRRVEGIDIVMIVLDVDGTMAAGSAVVGAGRPFALGRATWAALSL
ncbi:MAG: hypothetical protein ACR2N2_12535 [Acidimicrobiia bacterium]